MATRTLGPNPRRVQKVGAGVAAGVMDQVTLHAIDAQIDVVDRKLVEAGRLPEVALGLVERRVALHAVLVPERPAHLRGLFEAPHDEPERVLGGEDLHARPPQEALAPVTVDAAKRPVAAALHSRRPVAPGKGARGLAIEIPAQVDVQRNAGLEVTGIAEVVVALQLVGHEPCRGRAREYSADRDDPFQASPP